MGTVELVRRALHFQYPSRLPLVFRSDDKRSDIITRSYGAPAEWQPSEEDVDEWGCRRQNIIGTGIGMVIEEPLAQAPTLAGYPFPDPHAEGRYTSVEETLTRYPDRYIAASMRQSGFTRMANLRGFENLLCDLCEDRGFFELLADRVFAFEAGLIEEYGRRGVQAVWHFSDLGSERGLLMAPAIWRQVFKPRLAEQARQVHSLGMDYFLHSCGNVWEIIPDLIELGFDMLNLEQPLVFSTPEQNGIDRLAEFFGGRICFCTNVDSQRTLITGSREEVVAEAEHLVRALARPAGGLIPLADCGQDHNTVPPENTVAQAEAFVRLAKR